MWWLLTSCLLFDSASIDFPDESCCEDTATVVDADEDGVTIAGGDCNDGDATIFPGADELCDGVDHDCDGLVDQSLSTQNNLDKWYLDADQDGYGQDVVVYVCPDTSGWSESNDDCNDDDATIYPGAEEVCDEVDNSCNGLIDGEDPAVLGDILYKDADGDGFGGTPETTCLSDGFVSLSGDCNDNDAAINPSASEVPLDLIDQDCDGLDIRDYSDCGQVAECSEIVLLGNVEIPFQRVEAGEDPMGLYQLTYPFSMMSMEVTQQLYTALGLVNNSQFPNNGPMNPVENVSWHEAAMAAEALTEFVNNQYGLGLASCYDCDGQTCVPTSEELECTGYRLPTSAEWEYASRARTTQPFSADGLDGGSDIVDAESCQSTDGKFQSGQGHLLSEYAWYCANANGTPQHVGGLLPNPWGFYDLQGNVAEWVYDNTETDFQVLDPFGFDPQIGRGLVRGGAFWSTPEVLRNDVVETGNQRYQGQPHLGFRLLRRLAN